MSRQNTVSFSNKQKVCCHLDILLKCESGFSMMAATKLRNYKTEGRKRHLASVIYEFHNS